MPASRRLASPSGGNPSLRWPRLADVRIRSKLGLILVIPVLAIATLAVLRLGDANRQAQDAELVGALTDLSTRASAAAHELHRERMVAAAALAVPTSPIDPFRAQTTRTTEAINAYTGARNDLGTVPATVRDRLRRIDVQLGTLGALRDAVAARQGIALSEVVLRYGLIVTELVSYRESLSQATTDTRLANSLIAAAAFSKAKLLVGNQEAIIFAALRAGALDGQQYSAFIATLTGQQEALVTFALTASPGQRSRVDATIAGDAVQLADDITAELRRSVDGRGAAVTAEQASSALGAVNDLMRRAEQQIDTDLGALTAVRIEQVRRQVLLEAVVVILVLALLIALAFVTAQSMARTLRRLRDGALLVADQRLAEAVDRLRDAEAVGQRSPAEIAAGVPDTIRINSRDEIGEVAQAFHVVHREAVRIAAEQAVLRASVSAMFLNLARRSQSLVDRMIGQLDGIEREEQDPQRLAQLFKLDHLATRMRRNDENVLVLAGADTAPARRDNAPLADVAQAAQSEVELYERIEFDSIDEDVSVSAHAVNDVVRLLAELLDNATRFSPPNTTVTVVGRRVGDNGYLRVEDRGLGMSPEDLAAHNARFAAPPTIDVTTFRMMGLAVVSRLAYRHGIRVRLSENPGGGTVAEVTLPPNVVVLPLVRNLPSAGAPPLAGGRRSALSAAGPGSPDSPADQAAPAIGAAFHSPNGTATPATSPTSWPVFPPARTATPPTVPPTMPPAMPTPVPPTMPPTMPTAMPTPVPAHSPVFPSPASPVGPLPVRAGAGAAAGASAPPVDQAGSEAATQVIPAATPWPVAGEQMAVHPSFLAQSASDRWAGLFPDPAEEARAARQRDPGDTTEMPIFREIQATWFRTLGHTATGGWPLVESPPAPTQTPTQKPAQAPAPASAGNTGEAARPAAPVTARASAPRPEPAPEHDELWRTRADVGWRAAAAAVNPPVKDRTRSGLPKRQPRAQLVPGGVSGRPATRSARNPEETRGRLSAYHRGVQRGRASTAADSNTNEGNPR